MKTLTLKFLTPAFALFAAAFSCVHAADQAWNASVTSGNWGAGTSWLSGNATAANDRLTFNGDGVNTAYTVNNDLAADTQIGNGSGSAITFGNATNGNATSGGNFTLTGNRFVLNGTVTSIAGPGTNPPGPRMNYIQTDVVLNANRTFTLAGGSQGATSVTISGNVSCTGGTFGFIKSGSSSTSLTLSGTNTYNGTNTINAGSISITSAAGLGDGSATNNVSLNGGILTVSDGYSTTLGTNRTVTLVAGKTSNLNAGTNASLTVDGLVGGTGNLTKGGAGLVFLTAANTFEGLVSVQQGILVANTIANAGTASSLGTGNAIATIQLGSGNISGTLRYNGTVASTTNRSVSVGSNTAAENAAVIINNESPDAASSLAFTNSVFNVQNPAATNNRTLTLGGANTGNNTIQGVIQNNNANATVSLTKSGTGTWILSGNNTYTGNTAISDGILRAVNANALGTTAAGTTVSSGSRLELDGGVAIGGEALSITGNGGGGATGALRSVTGNNTYGGAITLTGTSEITAIQDTLTLDVPSGNAIDLGAYQLSLNRNTGTIVIRDPIVGTGRIVAGYPGTLTLEALNTFSGDCEIANGRVVCNTLGNYGEAGSLGTGGTSGKILFGSSVNPNRTGTLEYVGNANVTSNRSIELITSFTDAGGGGSITNNGTGTLVFTAALFNTQNTGNNTRTLTLRGSNTGNNTIQGVIQDNNGPAVLLAKTDAGKWILSGNNTYSGNTTVSAGVLSLSGGVAIPDTNSLIINGGKVDLTSNETVGALVLGATPQSNNTYGSTSSSATVKDDTYFSGTGILTVGDGGGVTPANVTFTNASQSVAESAGTAVLTLTATGTPAGTITANVTFDSGNSTATTGDIGGYTTQTVTLNSGNNWTASVNVTITDDTTPEGDESAVFNLTDLTGSAVLGSPATHTVTIPASDSFAVWASGYNVTNSTTANNDADKFLNGEEYAFDLNPTVAEYGNVIGATTGLSGGNVTMTLAFNGNSSKQDINYVVRRSALPGFTSNTVVGFWNGTANWTTSNSTYFANETQSGNGTVKAINVNLSMPASTEPRQFLKVNIE